MPDVETAKTAPMNGTGWRAEVGPQGLLVTLSGDWAVGSHLGGGSTIIGGMISQAGSGGLSFASPSLGRWDSALLVFLAALRDAANTAGIGFDDAGLPLSARRLLNLLPVPQAQVKPRSRPGLVARLGIAALDLWSSLGSVTAFIGDLVLRLGAAFRGRLTMRGRDLFFCIEEAGVDALVIVAIVNILVGGILAFVGAIQLRKFGADIYVANLVGIAVIREMAALMTAIVMAGRTGGAYAAHIATMEGNEEIDALRVIGIPIFDYLVFPRIGALCFTMPFLYLYGAAVAVFGGFLVAVLLLHLTAGEFITHVSDAVNITQVVFGLVKSLTFGAVIALIGCREGLRAGRSAADVGRAATSAVVLGIVWVIALDALFAVCANALDF